MEAGKLGQKVRKDEPLAAAPALWKRLIVRGVASYLGQLQSRPESKMNTPTQAIGQTGDGGAACTVNSAELTAAMHRLSLALGAASRPDPNERGHGRHHVVQALVAVNQLIAALFPNMTTLPVPLIDLACALKDLDRGIVAPMLKPADISHRPPNAITAELFRALPAAAMTLMMRMHSSRGIPANHRRRRWRARI